MKMEWKSCFKIGTSLFLLYLCVTYWQSAANVAGLVLGAAMPLLIGCIIAYLVNILVSCYEKHYFKKSTNKALIKSRRPVCMVAAFLTLVAVVYLIIRLIFPQLWSCVEVILAGVPGVLQKVVEFIAEYEILPENITDTLAVVDWRSQISQIIQVLTSGIGSVMEVLITTVTSVFSWIVSALLSVIFAIYILSGRETGAAVPQADPPLSERDLDREAGLCTECYQ